MRRSKWDARVSPVRATSAKRWQMLWDGTSRTVAGWRVVSPLWIQISDKARTIVRKQHGNATTVTHIPQWNLRWDWVRLYSRSPPSSRFYARCELHCRSHQGFKASMCKLSCDATSKRPAVVHWWPKDFACQSNKQGTYRLSKQLSSKRTLPTNWNTWNNQIAHSARSQQVKRSIWMVNNAQLIYNYCSMQLVHKAHRIPGLTHDEI